MKPSGDYRVVLKKSPPRYIPKKVLRHAKIPVSDKYTFNASIWVADTRESHFKPTVNLTIQHNGDRVRFCFPNVPEMLLAMDALQKFVGLNCVTVDNIHRVAVREYLEFHQTEEPIPINDYTVFTVIQEKARKRGKNKRISCNGATGEILSEETTPDETKGEGNDAA
jgi:hypothetical protein